MLARLRHHAVVGGDDHEVEVDPGRAGDHHPHEALVTRHVDDRDVPPARQHQRREPELDRHAARLLLRQAVGVHAGQRPHERGLAVVDVAGGPERQGRVHGCTARTAAATSRASSSVSVRGSSSSRPSWMRPTTAGSRARSLAASSVAPAGYGSIATAGPGSSSSGSAPPPTRAVDATTSPPVAAASSVGARAEGRVVGVEHREHRQRAARGGRIAMQGERRLQRGERQLVDPHGARERMAAARRDGLARPDQQAGLRAAEQLVARERRERGAGADRPAHRRLAREQLDVLGQHAGADVVDHGHAEAAQLLDLDLLDEADGAEVRRMRAQDRPGLLAAGRQRGLVVGAARAVRRAHLDEPRARGREDLGDPEAAADLDQLPARDDGVAAARERRARQQHRGGAVVDGDRRLRAGQLAQQLLDVVVARAALAARRGRARGSSSRRRCARPPPAPGSESGARPRFVCTTTPVALSTRRSRGRRRSRARATRSTSSPAPPSSSPRRASSSARATEVASGRPGGPAARHARPARPPPPAGRRTAARAGGRGRSYGTAKESNLPARSAAPRRF